MTYTNKKGYSHGWLKTVPEDARDEIYRIMNTLDPAGGRNKQGEGRYYKWAVRLSPTTGPARDVILIQRSPTTHMTTEHVIMLRGKLL